MGREQALERI